jgi:UPF0176 protein
MQVCVATFYKFVALPDYQALKPTWYQHFQQLGLRGSLLLAAEGLNATLAGTPAAMSEALDYLRQDPRLSDLSAKFSQAPEMPFQRLKVRLKREIVHLGVPEVDPTQQVGTYVPPQQWNQLLQDPEVVLIDTRNTYETAIGTFSGAVDPGLEAFEEFPAYVQNQLNPQQHRKIAMFCTGGIRCEKASAYMLQQGFAEVYHLEGGILRYLEEVSPEQSLWQGECFVFDDRVAVDHALQPTGRYICRRCNQAFQGTPSQLADGRDACVDCSTQSMAKVSANP